MSLIDEIRAELPAEYLLLTNVDERMRYWMFHDTLLHAALESGVTHTELLVLLCEHRAVQAEVMVKLVERAHCHAFVVPLPEGPCQN